MPPSPATLLRAIGHAVIECVGDDIVRRDLAMIPALPKIAEFVWTVWAEGSDEGLCRSEMKAVALLPPEDLRSRVQEIVRTIAADRPPAVRQILNTYLSLVPSQIRQALRRPADPTGTTIPNRLLPRNPEQFLLFLPVDIPIFEPGDRPLPGVDWVLTELLGIGGFGEVWKAVNPHFECIPPVVLKFYLGKDAHDNQAFLHEAALLNRVMPKGYHPGIVELRTTYLASDPPCLEYEYIGDGDLTQIIQRRSERGGLPPAEATKVLLQLASTVGHFHMMDPPIVHRDLKPSNILVKRMPNGKLRFKIIDFGIGGLASTRELRKSRDMASLGFILSTALHGSHTPLYASPEQIRGNPPDPRDDVHALGVIWYQMVSGDLTGGAPTGLDWVSDLFDRGLREEHINLFASCFASRADRRPANAAVLADRLRALLPSMLDPKRRRKGDSDSSPDLSLLAARNNSWSAPAPAPSAPVARVVATPTPQRPAPIGHAAATIPAQPSSAPSPSSSPGSGSGFRRDGQGLATVGQPGYDDMSLKLLIAALRQQAPKVKTLCRQLESAVRNGYFSKQLVWSVSRACHMGGPAGDVTRTICRRVFGVVPQPFVDERELPFPDSDGAERAYEQWRDAVCRGQPSPRDASLGS